MGRDRERGLVVHRKERERKRGGKHDKGNGSPDGVGFIVSKAI